VETGVNYAIVLSNCAGMFGHILGDTVEFVSLDPPRLRFTGRTAYMLSPFGEHLIDVEIEDSMAMAAERIQATITDYSVGAVFPQRAGELGGHLYIVEFADGAPAAARVTEFAAVLDRALCDTNEDYAAHRAGGYGMSPPRIHPVPAGTFAAWMKSRGQLGGQHKVPRVINDTDLFDGLKAFANYQERRL
jgi:GH3 auxin-responsive promoter